MVEHMARFGDADLWEWALAAMPGPRQAASLSLQPKLLCWGCCVWPWLAATHPSAFAGHKLSCAQHFSQGPL